MIDVNILLRNWLLSDSDITTLLGGSRVYGVDLPEKFDPADGPGITLNVRGGSAHAEAPIILPSMQLRVWAGVEQYKTARQVYLAVFDKLHGATNVNRDSDGVILSCLEQTEGQDVTDPDTGWATVVGFFQLTARSN